MGAIPNKLPGFQDIEKDPEACARYEEVCGVAVIPKYGRNLTQMFEAMEHGELSALYVIGENPASSEADVGRARKLMGNLDTLIVQDLFMTKTAEMADVVLPATNAALESEGSVTNSERRVQRVRKVLDPPGEREGRHLDHRAAREAARASTGARSRRARRGTSFGASRRCTPG